jgi:hypothetical protein
MECGARFAGGSPKKRWFEAAFIFFRKSENSRCSKVQDYEGQWFGHHVRLAKPEDVDAEVEAWFREALE